MSYYSRTRCSCTPTIHSCDMWQPPFQPSHPFFPLTIRCLLLGPIRTLHGTRGASDDILDDFKRQRLGGGSCYWRGLHCENRIREQCGSLESICLLWRDQTITYGLSSGEIYMVEAFAGTRGEAAVYIHGYSYFLSFVLGSLWKVGVKYLRARPR